MNNVKKLVSFTLAISIIISCFTLSVGAVSNKYSELSNTVYITDSFKNTLCAIEEGIKPQKATSQNDDNLNSATIIMADYNSVKNDNIAKDVISEQIRNGKMIYLRTNENMNRSDIASLFGLGELNGQVTYSPEYEAIAQNGTLGYFLYISSTGVTHIVPQWVVYLGDLTQQPNQSPKITLDSAEKLESLYSQMDKLTFEQELDVLNFYLQEKTKPNLELTQNTEFNGIQAQTFDSYPFEDELCSISCYATVKTNMTDSSYVQIGKITGYIGAKRIECATSNWSNPNYLSSRWAFMVDMHITPKFNVSTYYRAVNSQLCAYYITRPTDSTHATYKMLIRDYCPKVTLSDVTTVTLGISTGVGYPSGIGLTTSQQITTTYKDIDIYVPYWETGINEPRNMAGIRFTINGGTSASDLKPIHVSDLSLISGAYVWNYYTNFISIHIGASCGFRVFQGMLSTPIDVYNSGYMIYSPANWY